MDDSLGLQWFEEVFLKNCGPERPQLLILDGHSSHETLGLLMKAFEEKVEVLSLPPHTTHYLQPLDRSVFGPLNRQYNQLCSAYLQENPLNQINKWTFCGIFRKAWENGVCSANIVSGFRSCGIYPVDSTAVPEVAYAPSAPSDRLIEQVGDAARVEVGDAAVVNVGDAAVVEVGGAAGVEVGGEAMVEVGGEAMVEVGGAAGVEVGGEAVVEVGAVDMEFEDNVLDISDPNTLLQMLTDGGLVAHPLLDADGEEIVVDLGLNQPIPEIDTTIEATFLPPKIITSQPIVKTERKHVTSHRLLTSPDIIKQKLEKQKIKQETEEKRLKKIKKN